MVLRLGGKATLLAGVVQNELCASLDSLEVLTVEQFSSHLPDVLWCLLVEQGHGSVPVLFATRTLVDGIDRCFALDGSRIHDLFCKGHEGLCLLPTHFIDVVRVYQIRVEVLDCLAKCPLKVQVRGRRDQQFAKGAKLRVINLRHVDVVQATLRALLLQGLNDVGLLNGLVSNRVFAGSLLAQQFSQPWVKCRDDRLGVQELVLRHRGLGLCRWLRRCSGLSALDGRHRCRGRGWCGVLSGVLHSARCCGRYGEALGRHCNCFGHVYPLLNL